MARKRLGRILKCKTCGKERYCPRSEIKKHKREYCKKCWYLSEEYMQLCRNNGYLTMKLHPSHAHELGKISHANRIKKLGFKKYQEEQRNFFHKWKKRAPREYFQHQKEAGKKGGKLGWQAAIKKHPDLPIRAAKAFQKKYPNHMKEVQVRWKKKDPVGYRKHHKLLGKLTHKKHPQLRYELGLKGIKAQREGKPYLHAGVPYDSNEEREIAKKFLKYRIVKKFIVEKNCHVPIKSKFGSIEVDFFVNGIFIEYHPVVSYYERGETFKEHYNRKRKILTDAGFGKNKLIVFDKVNDFEVKVLPLLIR
jgi:hypothetical protein